MSAQSGRSVVVEVGVHRRHKKQQTNIICYYPKVTLHHIITNPLLYCDYIHNTGSGYTGCRETIHWLSFWTL